ncbi:GNAT family N-acetyltransferase [Aquibacillus kalidii]|uniref:GNAT family N-acetyltransferase n=1 Tax=Aquibacillus kalidii TaxID=2762597 RepID=UPI00164817F4|nr:GNAT family protein [Aquibacillus kalidii]
MVLIGKHILLHPLSKEDVLSLIYEGELPKSKYKHAYRPSDAVKAFLPVYLETLENDPCQLGYGPWVMEEKQNTALVGELLITKLDQSCIQIGYEVSEKYRNRGIAQEAVALIEKWCATKQIGKINATCEQGNKASHRVLLNNMFFVVSQEDNFLQFEKEIKHEWY